MCSCVKQFLKELLDALLPPTCHICRSFIPNSGNIHICPRCHDKLPYITSPFCSICGIPFNGVGGNHCCGACLINKPHFDHARARFLYEGSIRNLIHSFKYNRQTHLRSPLALLAMPAASKLATDIRLDIIIPVPLHRSRLRQRGFNQAALLGKTMSRHLHIPMVPDALARIRPTEPQIQLSASERLTNVSGAFAVKFIEHVADKKVLLIDDVMTTGSTMNECAKELKKAGADMVVAATIARTPR